MAGRQKLSPAEPGTHVQIVDRTPPDIAAAEVRMHEHQQAVLDQFGDGLPWSLAHYELEIRNELRRGCDAFLRAGRYLVVARECAVHGEWQGMLDRLGLSQPQVHRMMEAARRISGLPNRTTSTDLIRSAETSGKLIELLSLPEDQFAELATDGETNGISLGDVERMTVRELRAAVREARDTIAAKDERSTERERKIEKLQLDLAKAKRERAKATPDEVAEQLRDELSRAVMEARASLISTGEGSRSVRNAVSDLIEHGVESGSDHREYIAGLLQELLTDLRIVRDEHLLRIIDEQG